MIAEILLQIASLAVGALTTWFAPLPLLFPNPPVPVKAAETVCEPRVRLLVLNVAWPVPSTVTGEPALPWVARRVAPA